MAPSPLKQTPRDGTQRVRDHLLTSLHLGRLVPGDRVVSVRRLADLTGLNRKTIHRAYRELSREGLLRTRPGAGTFVAETSDPEASGLGENELLRAAHRCLAEARALRMSPDRFAAFIGNYLGGGLAGVPVAVVECNREQTGLISDDLARGLGVAPKPVLLQDLRAGAAAVSGVRAIVTTDCHRNEVVDAVAGIDVPVYRVALDAAFPRSVLGALARGPLVMVVRDETFAPVFRRLLVQLGADEPTLARLAIVEPRAASRALARAGESAVVCVSPVVAAETLPRIPTSAPRLAVRWRVPAAAIERVKVAMACDLAEADRT